MFGRGDSEEEEENRMSNLPAPPPEPAAPQVKKKRHYLLWGILVVVAIIGIAELATSTTKSETPTNTVPGVGQGLGSQDASGDVSLGSCPTSYGVVTCGLTIVNSSDGTS